MQFNFQFNSRGRPGDGAARGGITQRLPKGWAESGNPKVPPPAPRVSRLGRTSPRRSRRHVLLFVSGPRPAARRPASQTATETPGDVPSTLHLRYWRSLERTPGGGGLARLPSHRPTPPWCPRGSDLVDVDDIVEEGPEQNVGLRPTRQGVREGGGTKRRHASGERKKQVRAGPIFLPGKRRLGFLAVGAACAAVH